MEVKVGVCEAGDLAKVVKDIGSTWENAANFFECDSLEEALDHSVLSLHATDASGNIVGLLALEVAPSMEDITGNEAVGGWIASETSALGYARGTTLWLRLACLAKKDAERPLREMVKFAFSRFAHIQCIALCAVNKDYLPNKALGMVIPMVSKSEENSCLLYLVDRADVCPRVVVRPAKVEDHDDLVPVVRGMRSKFPDLAELPDSVKPGEEFALARLIENDSWKVLVATVEREMVGMMCLQEVSDLSHYQENFDLEMFDNLSTYAEEAEPPQQKEEEEEEVEVEENGEGEGAAEGEVEEEGGVEGEVEGEKAAEDGAEVAEGAEPGAQAQPQEPEAAEEEEEGDGAGEGADEEEDFEFTDDDASGEDEKAKAEEGEAGVAEHSRDSLAFAVKMFCMMDEYADEAADFLQPAFDLFPGKDYCIATLSHGSRVPSLFSNFTLAQGETHKLSSDVLYVMHRYSLLRDFETELCSKGDYNEVLELLGELSEDQGMLEQVNAALDKNALVKASCQGQIVGVCAVCPEVEVAELNAHFQLPAFSETLQYRKYNFGELTALVMNPVFAYQKKLFLGQVMRLVGRTSLCFKLDEAKPVADVLDVFEPVPRRRGAGECGHVLFVLNQRDLCREKDPANARVLVVGASSCGLACLESLLRNPQYQFTNLTLVTSEGEGRADVASLASEHAFLSQVRLITSSVVEVDREDKQVFLEDGTALSYDILVLTSGVKDQVAGFSPQEGDLPVVPAASLAAHLGSLGEGALPSHAVVYGGRVEAFDCLAELDARGVEYTFAAPETSPTMRLVESVAKDLKIDGKLRKASRMTLTGIERGTKERALSLSFVNSDGTAAEAETDLLVLAHTQNVDPHIFGCLNDSSIVYDGRLVVNGDFCTTDEDIFGCGTLAKFSRLYGGLAIEDFSSQEVGRMLAENITAKCERASGARPPAPIGGLAPAPVFKEPVGFSYRLPHEGHQITYVARPPLGLTEVVPPEGGVLLRTEHEGQLATLGIDANGVVSSVCFCGPKPSSLSRCQVLVGLHSAYLGKKSAELDKLECLYTYLTGSWADALYSDQVLLLRKLILAQGLPKRQTKLRETIQQGVLELVKENVQDFPKYTLPYTGGY